MKGLAVSFKKNSNNRKRNQNLLWDTLAMSYTVKHSTLLQFLLSPVKNVTLFLNLHNLYQLADWVQSWHLLWTDIADTHIHQWDLPHFVKYQHSAHDTSSDIGRSQCKICKIQKKCQWLDLFNLKVAFKNINLQSLAHKQILCTIKYNSITCDISYWQILITLIKLLLLLLLLFIYKQAKLQTISKLVTKFYTRHFQAFKVSKTTHLL